MKTSKKRKRSLKSYSSNTKKTEVFNSALLQWGKQNFRNYPWRHTSDPYLVLLAEFMLQRTRADQVLSVYVETAHRFPSIGSIVSASDNDIAKVMEPLGLSYRAARLKTLAKKISEQYHGQIPSRPEELMQLPGVGRYIANAVCCFAFGKNLPIVDANIIRILSRVFSFEFGPDPHKKEEPWRFLETALTVKSQKINWALLDLGDMVCTPRNPKCSSCPLQVICDYRQRQVERAEAT